MENTFRTYSDITQIPEEVLKKYASTHKHFGIHNDVGIGADRSNMKVTEFQIYEGEH